MFEARIYPSIPLYSFFQKTSSKEIADKLAESEKEKTESKRIRCPLCKWQPPKSSRWCCADCDFPEFFYGACYTFWNTFETGGKCPGCLHQWRWTSCLRCEGWSLHEDWYVKESD